LRGQRREFHIKPLVAADLAGEVTVRVHVDFEALPQKLEPGRGDGFEPTTLCMASVSWFIPSDPLTRIPFDTYPFDTFWRRSVSRNFL